MKAPANCVAVMLFAVFTLALAACNSANHGGPPPAYTVGGTVVNFAGAAGTLVLKDNLSDTLPVSANGNFAFAIPVPSGGSYSVTISEQPSNPSQTCGVVNGTGTATANVTNIQVNCGHNEWEWVGGANAGSQDAVFGTMGVAAPANNPGARLSSVTWTDASGNLWLFGGYYYNSGVYRLINDLWEYTTSGWIWMGGSNVPGASGSYGTLGAPNSANIPGARNQAVGFTDASGDFWLFGGTGYDSTGTQGSLNDLWKYSNGEWTWMSGSNLVGEPGVYGTLGVPAPSNSPGARFGAVSWTDSSGNLWLFGGFGYNSSGSGGAAYNDLWKFSGGEWTWVSGSNTTNQNGVYGARGVSAPGNAPGARYWGVSWMDSSGDLWLFGGTGYGATGFFGFLNDLWRFSNGQWTWMSGSNQTYQSGTYGALGVASAGNVPGSRQNAVSWTDLSGNLWLFGGNGNDSAGGEGLLNDLWKFSDGEWTWMSGSNVINQSGVYGTRGMLFPGNIPGARGNFDSWVDANGNLWLFGGYGVAGGAEVYCNDLWMYMP